MASMSATRIRSLYRRHTQAYEAFCHFSANSVGHSIVGVLANPNHRNLASTIDERFRAAVRREMEKAGLA